MIFCGQKTILVILYNLYVGQKKLYCGLERDKNLLLCLMKDKFFTFYHVYYFCHVPYNSNIISTT